MINLIPNEEKSKMKSDFFYHFLVMTFFVCGISVFVSGVALLPAYFSVSVKKDLVDQKLKAQAESLVSTSDQETLAQAKDLNNKLKLIENSNKNKFIVSQKVINAVLIHRIAGIKITQISYEIGPSGEKKIKIGGLAPSRDTLLLFRLSLDDDPLFSKVDLPISNFVKGSDISFYITLVTS